MVGFPMGKGKSGVGWENGIKNIMEDHYPLIYHSKILLCSQTSYHVRRNKIRLQDKTNHENEIGVTKVE